MPAPVAILATLVSLVQAAPAAPSVSSEWAPLPFLSFGSLIALFAAAVGYGRLAQQVKSSAREFNDFKQHDFANLQQQVGEMATAVARIDERTKHGSGHPSHLGNPGPPYTPERSR